MHKPWNISFWGVGQKIPPLLFKLWGGAKQSSCGIGCHAFMLTFVPYAMLILPLYAHTSDFPWIGSYGMGYFSMLVIVSTLTMLIAVAVAVRCNHSGTLRHTFDALVFLGATLVALIGAELFLRLTANDPFSHYRTWGHKKSAILGYEAQPNYTWKAAGATYSTDEIGFRTHLTDQSWSRSANGRIFVLGGSSVFGYGLEDDETWPHLLEARLQSSLYGASFYVINAGNNGHNSLQLLLRFYLTVLPKNPNFLLYYEANNDEDPGILMPNSIWLTEQTWPRPTLLVKSRRSISNAMGQSFSRGMYSVFLAFKRPMQDRFLN